MATHFCILAWRIPRTEDPGRLQSTGLQKVRYDWATNTTTYTWSTNKVTFCKVNLSEFIKIQDGHNHNLCPSWIPFWNLFYRNVCTQKCNYIWRCSLQFIIWWLLLLQLQHRRWSKWPPRWGCLKKLKYIRTMEYYAAINRVPLAQRAHLCK